MSQKRKPQPRSAPWMPLVRLAPLAWTDAKRDSLRADALVRQHSTPEAVDAWLAHAEQAAMTDEVHGNDRYLVHVDRRPDGTVEALSFRRLDRKPIRDWRDMQRIKNELAGYETEAVELFPADSRLMDSANHYWLWCNPPGVLFPIGYNGGLVSNRSAGGSRQRPIGEHDRSFTLRAQESIGYVEVGDAAAVAVDGLGRPRLEGAS